jgi:hypothetical protein
MQGKLTSRGASAGGRGDLDSSIIKGVDVQDRLQRQLAHLGYPGFGHVRSEPGEPAEVVLLAVTQPNLEARLAEALPWVLSNHSNLDWDWLRTNACLNNAQNRLGYLVHLARSLPNSQAAGVTLEAWEKELEASRLDREGTLCHDDMSKAERVWLMANRPEAAVHWRLLTDLTVEHLWCVTH